MTFSKTMIQEISEEATPQTMQKSPAATMYELLSGTLTEAALEGRLTHGLSNCAAALSREPNDVVLCILPWDLDSVNHKIQLLLAESVCLEYDILTLKVDMSQLQSLRSYSFGKLMVPEESSLDLNCYLINANDNGLSTSERKLIYNFCSSWSTESTNTNDSPD